MIRGAAAHADNSSVSDTDIEAAASRTQYADRLDPAFGMLAGALVVAHGPFPLARVPGARTPDILDAVARGGQGAASRAAVREAASPWYPLPSAPPSGSFPVRPCRGAGMSVARRRGSADHAKTASPPVSMPRRKPFISLLLCLLCSLLSCSTVSEAAWPSGHALSRPALALRLLALRGLTNLSAVRAFVVRARLVAFPARCHPCWPTTLGAFGTHVTGLRNISVTWACRSGPLSAQAARRDSLLCPIPLHEDKGCFVRARTDDQTWQSLS